MSGLVIAGDSVEEWVADQELAIASRLDNAPVDQVAAFIAFQCGEGEVRTVLAAANARRGTITLLLAGPDGATVSAATLCRVDHELSQHMPIALHVQAETGKRAVKGARWRALVDDVGRALRGRANR